MDLASRLLIPIIVLQNHNRYNIMEKGHNYSIDIAAIESEVSCFLLISAFSTSNCISCEGAFFFIIKYF